MPDADSPLQDPFRAGTVVTVTLNNPREKYFGALMAVSPAGVALRGMDLNSFEDFMRLVREGEEVAANAVFFPMHRIERMEMDARNAEIPSLQERFESKTSKAFAAFFHL
jgi:hypothetical protein